MTAIVPSQTRAPLHHAIQQHAQPPASTLVSDQSKVYAADFDVDKVDLDLFLIDTTAGNVEATLLAGAKYHAGKVYKFQKTASANTMKVTAYGTEEIEGSGDIDITAENGMLAIQWDPHSETWRRAYPGQATGANDGFALDDLSNVDPATGRDALGATVTGAALFVATDAAAARTAIGATVTGSSLVTATDAAAARTTLGVSPTTESDLKADVHMVPVPGRVDLVGANAWEIRFRMGFAGTFTRISSVLSGAALDADAVGTLLIAGGAVTGGVVTHANAAAAGDAQDQAITAGGAFTANQEIRYTVSGGNSSTSFAGVALEFTRA